MRRAVVSAVLAVAIATALVACGGDCTPPSACAALVYSCPAGSVSIGQSGFPVGGRAGGGAGDIVMRNDRVTAVIDALASPHMLAPTGGTLIDLVPAGGVDELNGLYQAAGVLPADSFHYTSLEIVDDSPRLVAVIARGTLDERADVAVLTRWELRPCEPGVRVRSELVNRSAEPFAFFLGDVSYWGGRQPLPFTPAPGEGFVQPELDLVTLASWRSYPFVAARSYGEIGTTYALVPCDRAALEGVNDYAVTAVGTSRQIVGPGETLTLERFVVTAAGPSVDGVVRLAEEARALLGRPTALVTLGGAITPAVGSGAPVSIVASRIVAGEAPAPFTEAVAAADGSYTLTVPAGETRLDVWAFGRIVTSTTVVATTNTMVPPLAVPPPARLRFAVQGTDGTPRDAMVTIVPADEATRVATAGTQNGRFQTCAPWLGPPHGGSPACNHVLHDPAAPAGGNGANEVDVPAGHYFVYATMGPFATLARAELTLASGAAAAVTLVVDPLPEVAPGWMSADLHVHGRASFDSSIPDVDRVRAFAAAGIDVIAATDHDAVGTYADALVELGLTDRVHVMSGLETTGLIPFLHVPGDAFPRVIGHYNFWPVTYDASASRGGAPWDELVEPGGLFDRMAPFLPEHGLMMLNHPWDEPQFGRDLGYLRAIGYDPRLPVPPEDDGTAQGMLARRPGGDGGHSNMDFDLLEIMNGRSITKFLQYRQLWWALLNGGLVYAATANSDSHGLTDAQLGYPRNLVPISAGGGGGGGGAFDAATFNAAVNAGRGQGSYGVVIAATIDGAPFGLTPLAVASGATLAVELRAAPWIPVDELRLVVNGVVVRTVRTGFSTPADPFGVDGVVRWQGTFALAPLLPAGAGDAWLVVEAGLALPLAADLDDDGVVDTTDNDGDGLVDQRDVEAGEDSGPLTDPPDPLPADAADDARFHLTAIAPGTWPNAFTNPFLLDVDGDGVWEAPGL